MTDSYAKRPGQSPTSYSSDVADNALAEAYLAATGKTLPKTARIKPWKRWVESSAEFDGVDRGGLRDVLDADAQALNGLKGHVDVVDGREQSHYAELKDDIAELRAQQSSAPFPMR